MTLNLSSDWFPCKSRFGAPSAQSLIFETMSKFTTLHELLYNNNSVKGPSGPAEFYNAIAKCGTNLQYMRIKSCQYSPNAIVENFETSFKDCFR